MASDIIVSRSLLEYKKHHFTNHSDIFYVLGCKANEGLILIKSVNPDIDRTILQVSVPINLVVTGFYLLGEQAIVECAKKYPLLTSTRSSIDPTQLFFILREYDVVNEKAVHKAMTVKVISYRN